MSNKNVLIYQINSYARKNTLPKKTLRVFENVFQYDEELQRLRELEGMGGISKFDIKPLTKSSPELSDVKTILKNFDSVPTKDFALLLSSLV